MTNDTSFPFPNNGDPDAHLHDLCDSHQRYLYAHIFIAVFSVYSLNVRVLEARGG